MIGETTAVRWWIVGETRRPNKTRCPVCGSGNVSAIYRASGAVVTFGIDESRDPLFSYILSNGDETVWLARRPFIDCTCRWCHNRFPVKPLGKQERKELGA